MELFFILVLLQKNPKNNKKTNKKNKQTHPHTIKLKKKEVFSQIYIYIYNIYFKKIIIILIIIFKKEAKSRAKLKRSRKYLGNIHFVVCLFTAKRITFILQTYWVDYAGRSI